MKFYTGVGARKAPPNILKEMTKIASFLEDKGYTLRSGGAEGSDQAFESGVKELKEIYVPKQATSESIELASKVHPAWYNCNYWVQKIHGRNVMQVLGLTLDKPSSFLICWTKDGRTVGGTATAMKIAGQNNIPIYNLNKDSEKLWQHLLTL